MNLPRIVTLAALFLCAAANAQQLYWAGGASTSLVCRVNLDGTGSATFTRSDFGEVKACNTTGKLYWSNFSSGTIERANLDFTGVQTIVSGLGSTTGRLAVDPSANLIFWSDYQGSIGFASLSGGPVLGAFDLPGEMPGYLAVDPAHRKIYWTDSNSGGVLRANYDGSEQQTVLAYSYGAGGLALDLDAGKVYLAERGELIERANLDGTERERLGLVIGEPYSLDVSGGRVYWSTRYNQYGDVLSARLDGSDRKTILSALTGPYSVSVIPEPTASGLVGFGTWIISRRRR